jgi:1-deoxy-D-xylulose-5-phosphate reductoisomerase
MRVPISFALTYPDRSQVDLPRLDFSSGLVLEFEPVDDEAFPMLRLARRAGEDGGSRPCVFNAANEVAVAAFLERRLPFLGIPEVVERTLEAAAGSPAHDLDELVAIDAEARRLAEQALVAA